MTDEEEPDRGEEVLDELRRLREELEGEEELVSTEPREAYDLWIQQLGDASEATLETYWYRVGPFLRFLEDNDIDDLSEITTRHVREFEALRRSGDRTKQTLNNQLGTLRQFLEYCADLDAVSQDVPESVNVPELTVDDRVNTEKLVPDRASEILENLDRYRYASREHVVMLLWWRTTMRLGAVRSLDLGDLYVTEDDLERLRAELEAEGFLEEVIEGILEDSELPFIIPRHRPETGTPLKNDEGGERVINLDDSTVEVIQDYIDVNREDVEDGYGRDPLVTSTKGGGRLSGSGLRNWSYKLTQPCEFGDPCPYDEDPETCQARKHGHGSKCPGSKSPHKIRTGSITWHRDRGWPVDDLAAKANTSEEKIRGVYDQPEKLIRGAVRRQHLDKLEDE